MKSSLEVKISPSLLAITDYKAVMEKRLCPTHHIKPAVTVKESVPLRYLVAVPNLKDNAIIL